MSSCKITPAEARALQEALRAQLLHARMTQSDKDIRYSLLKRLDAILDAPS